MTTRQFTTFRTDTILPPSLRQAWEVVSADEQEILIRKVDASQKLTWDEIRARLQEAGKQITEEDLQEAIRHALFRSRISYNDIANGA